MRILKEADSLRGFIDQEKLAGKRIGFVPTMGSLHTGHVSLIEACRNECDVVIVSVYVNPTQFGPGEDFETYPRTLEADQKIAEAAGADLLFCPESKTIYPEGAGHYLVKVNARTEVLCGKSRPGHFDGVATVLTKLFNLVTPDDVYFGLKDAQQAAVVDGLITSFHFQIRIHKCPTIREEDGLAKSSRNSRLLPKEREEAPVIYRALKRADELVKNGMKSRLEIEAFLKSELENSLQSGALDYAEVLTYPGLNKPEVLSGGYILAAAVFYEQARLIDNITGDTTGNKGGRA